LQEREVISSSFVVASSDGAAAFELVEAALDEIAFRIELTIEFPTAMLALWMVADDDAHSFIASFVDEGV